MKNSPFRHVAVAIDDSPAAKAALSIALSIVAPDGELAFVHAINRAMVIAECGSPYGGDPGPAIDAFEQDERDLFSAAAARAKKHGLRSTTHALDGSAGSSIADFIRTGRYDAVVIGTHARQGLVRLVLGSTADTVLRASPVPTFVTSEVDVSRIEAGIHHLLVAVDGSEPAAAAVRCAVAFAQTCGAEIAFAYVTEDDAAHQAQAQTTIARARHDAARANVRSNIAILAGRPDQAIVSAAEATHADLIVIGTHGRTGLTHLRLGSVAEAVIRSAPLPVMVIPAGAPVAAAAVPSAVTAIG